MHTVLTSSKNVIMTSLIVQLYVLLIAGEEPVKIALGDTLWNLARC